MNPPATVSTPASLFDRKARAAFIIACLTLLVAAGGFRYVAIPRLKAYLTKEKVPLRQELGLGIPAKIGDWEAMGQDGRIDEAVLEELGTKSYLDRRYVRSGASPAVIDVHISYYTGMIDAVPHIPGRCLVANGWQAASLPRDYDLHVDRSTWRTYGTPNNLATGEPYPVMSVRHPIRGVPEDVTMPVGKLQLQTTMFRRSDSPSLRLFAGYFFIANGLTMAEPEAVRMKAFDLTSKYAYYCKVQFTMPAEADATAEQFIEQASDLLDGLLPELMRCLPDWPEIESRGAASAGTPAPAGSPSM